MGGQVKAQGYWGCSITKEHACRPVGDQEYSQSQRNSFPSSSKAIVNATCKF